MNVAERAISIRPLLRNEVAQASEIVRHAFATHLGMNADVFWRDRDPVIGRWNSYPKLSYAAVLDDKLVGCALAANWGRLAVLGPIATNPETWNRGVAKELVAAVLAQVDASGARHTVLLTFADSLKHIGLYQRFGFWPRYLTTIMTASSRPMITVPEAQRFSQTAATDKGTVLDACRVLTSSLSDGLDLTREIVAYYEAGYGDTVILADGSQSVGVAVCEFGVNSAAGAGACLIRFGAVQSGPGAETRFERLIAACAQLAVDAGLSRIIASVNAENVDVHKQLPALGFLPERNLVAMHRPNAPVYQTHSYVVSDWR